jgi:alcohol dehydrogenase (NADP+)
MTIKAYGTYAANKPLEPMTIGRRVIGPHDVKVDILYCGVCHSDYHHSREEWGVTIWPVVPGHEMVGIVAAIGSRVTRHKVGDTVGVGTIIDSCQHCQSCREGLEQFCDNGVLLTYNSKSDKEPGGHTLGGYAENIIADEKFVYRIRHAKDQLAGVAPLLCAGITTYSPLKKWGAGPGRKVGVVGIGGLGHVGVKFARALGAHTVAFTTHESKRGAALTIGAHESIVASNAKELEAHAGTFDLILDTVSAHHDLNTYLSLLRRDGVLCVLGVPTQPHPPVSVINLIWRRRCIAGSLIGSNAETQEMLDLCASRGIVADVEIIPIQSIETAFKRMLDGDVKYRFVIRNESLRG